MRTLVIGGAGFIGSHLCDALLEHGHLVSCVDNLSLGREANISHMMDKCEFNFYKADASEREELLAVFQKAQPEYVFHLAANSDIQASSKNPDVEYQNTYKTTYEVLHCMRELSIKKIFFASTSAVYGDKKDILLDEETANLSPISYYGAAKLGSEALISAFSYMDNIDALVFRFPNVVGPRLTHGVIFDFIHKLKKNPKELTVLGDGKQSKPYLHVKDLVTAIMLLIDKQSNGVDLYNVGVSDQISVTSIADIICEEMGLKDVKYHYTGGIGGWKGDVPRFQYSLEKIHETGWHAKLTSKEVIRATARAIL